MSIRKLEVDCWDYEILTDFGGKCFVSICDVFHYSSRKRVVFVISLTRVNELLTHVGDWKASNVGEKHILIFDTFIWSPDCFALWATMIRIQIKR